MSDLRTRVISLVSLNSLDALRYLAKEKRLPISRDGRSINKEALAEAIARLEEQQAEEKVRKARAEKISPTRDGLALRLEKQSLTHNAFDDLREKHPLKTFAWREICNLESLMNDRRFGLKNAKKAATRALEDFEGQVGWAMRELGGLSASLERNIDKIRIELSKVASFLVDYEPTFAAILAQESVWADAEKKEKEKAESA